jgi:hypothetical protein
VLDPRQVVDYERLQAAVTRANGRYDLAQRELDTLQARLNTVQSQVPSSTSPVQLVSMTTLVGRRLLTAAAVGLVVAAVLLVLLELLWPVRSTTATTLEPVPLADDGIRRATRAELGELPQVRTRSVPTRRVGEHR